MFFKPEIAFEIYTYRLTLIDTLPLYGLNVPISSHVM